MWNTRHCSANVTEAVFIYTFLRTTLSFSSFKYCKWKIPAVWIRPSWRQSDKRIREVYAGQEIVFKKICLFSSLLYFREQFTDILIEESSVQKSYYSFIVWELQISNLVRNTSHAERGLFIILQ